MEREALFRAYGKINLYLDVTGLLKNGYHKVEMVMQAISLHDTLGISVAEGKEAVKFRSSLKSLEDDDENTVLKALKIFKEETGFRGTVSIDLEKRIPVAGGLGGGSSDGAALLLAMDHLLGSRLSLDKLLSMAEKVGMDTPFLMLTQIKNWNFLRKELKEDERASYCALATGTGTKLKPLLGIDSFVVTVTPDIQVSTEEIYKMTDREGIKNHPCLEGFLKGLKAGNHCEIKNNTGNVLEFFAAKKYPIIVYTKNKMESLGEPLLVLMSGSGGTIFSLYEEEKDAQNAYEEMIKHYKCTNLTRTMI